MMPVISIVVTRFLMFEPLEKLHNTFWITAQDAPDVVLTDNLQIHTLELTAEKLGQLPTICEKLRYWLLFFHYADKKSEEEMIFLLQSSDPGPRDAYDKYLRFNQSKELRVLDEAREKSMRDQNSLLRGAERRGRAETLLRILTKRFSSVPESLRARIHTVTDLEHLEKLVDFALDCESLEAFSEML